MAKEVIREIQLKKLQRDNKKEDLANQLLDARDMIYKTGVSLENMRKIADKRLESLNICHGVLEGRREALWKAEQRAEKAEAALEEMKQRALKAESKVIEYNERAIEDLSQIPILKGHVKALEERAKGAERKNAMFLQKLKKSEKKVRFHRERFFEMRKLWEKRLKQFKPYEKGVLFHTDGTLIGSTLQVDGVKQKNLTTIKIMASINYPGVIASMEKYAKPYNRSFIFGEELYNKREEAKKAGIIADYVQSLNTDTIKTEDNLEESQKPMENISVEPTEWQCDHCWSWSPIKDTMCKSKGKKPYYVCPSCKQQTEKGKAFTN